MYYMYRGYIHFNCSSGSSSTACAFYICMYVHLQPFQYHKLDEQSIFETVTATKDELMHYYREMQTIRFMEERAKELYEQRKIRGFCHLYIGMVCVCVYGVLYVLLVLCVYTFVYVCGVCMLIFNWVDTRQHHYHSAQYMGKHHHAFFFKLSKHVTILLNCLAAISFTKIRHGTTSNLQHSIKHKIRSCSHSYNTSTTKKLQTSVIKVGLQQ